jgi:hypothetical protein
MNYLLLTPESDPKPAIDLLYFSLFSFIRKINIMYSYSHSRISLSLKKPFIVFIRTLLASSICVFALIGSALGIHEKPAVLSSATQDRGNEIEASLKDSVTTFDKGFTENSIQDDGIVVYESEFGPGEMGTPVFVEDITPEQTESIAQGYATFGFNQFVSDMISVNRSLPDLRSPWY